MGIKPVSYTNQRLTTQTPLAGNTNTHGTAFAGSLYAIEALTAWGLLYLALWEREIDASIIHAKGNIDFASPVKEDIVAMTSLRGHESLFKTLGETGKARLTLTTEIVAAGKTACQFSGLYLIRLN
jgi:thioesterase domain-containing protein